MHRFANPTRFLRFCQAVLPWAAVACVLTLGVGVTWFLFYVPADYQQGDTVRIMYVHVPAAWMALALYTCVAAGSVSALVWRHPLGEILAKAAAPIGCMFTALALVTGSLWGKPMWGTYWVWDARLTSVLVLFFLYLGYIALHHAFDNPDRGARAASILAIVGFINVPIIKFSVDWWNTLHQPASVVRIDGPTIHTSMLWPLLIMGIGFGLYALVVLIYRVRAEIADRKLRRLEVARVDAAERGRGSVGTVTGS